MERIVPRTARVMNTNKQKKIEVLKEEEIDKYKNV